MWYNREAKHGTSDQPEVNNFHYIWGKKSHVNT